MSKKIIGPVLIMFVGCLWAVDALIRSSLSATLPASVIVFVEHLVGFVFLIPFLKGSLLKLKNFSKKDWINVLLMTLVSSILGTILFTQALTEAFSVNDFSTPLVLQKLQPLLVVVLAAVFLKEKIRLNFFLLVPIALIGSYMVSFGTQSFNFALGGKEKVYLLSLGAAFCWGSGTILSKNLLKKLSFTQATAIRFMLAIPVGLVISLLLNPGFNFLTINFDQLLRFIIIALSTGAASVLLYYKGLQLTQAKVATFAELTFPIVGILIATSSFNPYGAPQILTVANVMGIVILLLSIIVISIEHNESS